MRLVGEHEERRARQGKREGEKGTFLLLFIKFFFQFSFFSSSLFCSMSENELRCALQLLARLLVTNMRDLRNV